MSVYLRLYLIPFLLFLLGGNVFAQSNPTNIEGKVLDEYLRPSANASVRLLSHPDSSVIATVASDANGFFEFKNIKPGSYLIGVSKVGYNRFFSVQYHIGEHSSTIKTADVKLVPLNFKIKEITITAKKDYIEVRPDKTVINIEKSIVAAGNNMFDVLRNAPGVKVSGDEILYKGGQKALVAINGKVSQYTGEQLAELLKSYPSSMVTSVELIDNPPAKYDAAGGGLINIVLKKDSNLGTRVSLTETAAIGENYKLNSSASINYRTKKLNVFGTYTFSATEIRRFWDVDRILNRSSEVNEFDMRYRSVNNSKNHSFNAGVDWAISPNQNLGVLFYGYANLSGIDKRNTTYVKTNSVLDSTVSTLSDIDRDVYNLNYNVNYKGTFGRNTLTADADYASYNRHSTENLTNNFLIAADNSQPSPLRYNIVSPADIDVYSLKLDFTHTFSTSANLSAGLKNSSVKSDNKIDFNEATPNGYTPVAALTDRFIYDEVLQAGYVSYKGKFKNTSITAGLRAEHTSAKRHAFNPDSRIDTNYLNLFPSAQVSQQLSEEHLLSFSYGRRISRPNYQDLNPFVAYIDPYAFSTGNPYLRPQYTHGFQLADVYKIKYKLALNFNIINDFYTTIYQQNDLTGGYTTIKSNIGKRYTYGAEITAPFDITNWWSIDNYISFSYDRYAYSARDAVHRNAFDLFVQANQYFTVGKNYKAELNATYDTPTYFGIKNYREQYYFSAGISRSILNNRGSVKLAVSDIFNTQIERYSSRYLNLNLTGREKPGTRFISATFTYRFGNNSLKAARKRTGGSGDEVSRLGD